MSILEDFDSVQGASPSASSILSDFDSIKPPGKNATPKDPAKWVPDSVETPEAPPEPKQSLLDKVKNLPKKVFGDLESAGSMATGAIAAPIGAAAGIVKGFTGGKYGTPEGAKEAQQFAGEVASSLTYQPRSEIGKENLSTIGKAIDSSKLAGLGPTEGITLAGVNAGPGRLPKPVQAPQAAPVAGRFASAGAAAADITEQAKAMTAGASPELQAAVAKAGPKTNIQVLERHVDADSLPVPVRLTKGQATQDVSLLSEEQNLRGKHQEFATRFNEQNKALIENTNAIREAAAPDVYATTKPAHGELIIDAYKAKDTALNADISKKYKALSEANGGQFPLDGKAFVGAADEALHKELLFDHVSPEIRKTLDRIEKTGSMSFENFESLRTNLARIQRSNTADGNAKAAAGTIRNALEDLPMPAGAENLKTLADEARAAVKERFTLIKGDPAYKAVVEGKASADKFIDKYIVGSDLKNVEIMKKNLAHDPVAQQTMSAGAMNQLKESAGIVDNTGNFSQAGYNKALEKIRPKLGVLFEPEQAKQVETLGRVSRYTQAQPRGSFVNNSNTATSMMAEGAKSAAEGAANVAAGGVPIGTWTRKIGGVINRNRTINEALQTGAGLKLKDVK